MREKSGAKSETEISGRKWQETLSADGSWQRAWFISKTGIDLTHFKSLDDARSEGY